MKFCDHCGQVLPGPVYELGRLRLDIAAHRATADDREITLTPTQFAILEILARRPGMLFTRDTILEQLEDAITENSLGVLVSVLRKKLQGVAEIPSMNREGSHGLRAYRLIACP